ncbi:MAG: hypothetical protein DMG05_00360, partial [Acidobacteria bacterium]
PEPLAVHLTFRNTGAQPRSRREKRRKVRDFPHIQRQSRRIGQETGSVTSSIVQPTLNYLPDTSFNVGTPGSQPKACGAVPTVTAKFYP